MKLWGGEGGPADLARLNGDDEHAVRAAGRHVQRCLADHAVGVAPEQLQREGTAQRPTGINSASSTEGRWACTKLLAFGKPVNTVPGCCHPSLQAVRSSVGFNCPHQVECLLLAGDEVGGQVSQMDFGV